MAARRMFAKSIVESARFLKMPSSTQNLYFHLNLCADDDGVVEAYSVLNMIKAHEDDLKVLNGKGFVIILNEDLVSYIVDWLEHNNVRADRKKDSLYQELLLEVVPSAKILEKKERSDVNKKSISSGLSMDGPRTDNGLLRVGEVRTGKVSLVECKYTLGNEEISESQFNELSKQFSKTLVENIIQRIIERPYKNCLNVKTITEWCNEAIKRERKPKKNSFNNYEQREYDFDELEKKMLEHRLKQFNGERVSGGVG